MHSVHDEGKWQKGAEYNGEWRRYYTSYDGIVKMFRKSLNSEIGSHFVWLFGPNVYMFVQCTRTARGWIGLT